MKLYALNEKESGKHPSCVEIPPQTEELACPHAMLETKRGGCYNLLKSILGIKHGIRKVLRMNKNILE